MTAQLDLFADGPECCCVTCDAGKRWDWQTAHRATGQNCPHRMWGWAARFPHYVRIGRGQPYVGPTALAWHRQEGPESPVEFTYTWWALSWYAQQTEPIR